MATLLSRREQDEATIQEIRRLESMINDYSQAAARSITLRGDLST